MYDKTQIFVLHYAQDENHTKWVKQRDNFRILERVKFPYWDVLNYEDSLCIKILVIFYIVNPNPNLTGPSTPQYGNYHLERTYLCMQFHRVYYCKS